MFSYRHAFHAGNHADVLKHITLLAILRHLMRKDSPLLLVDTHAGAGLYRLDEHAAQLSGEAARGIARLQAWQQARQTNAPTPASASTSTLAANPAPRQAVSPSMADALADYLQQIAAFNGGGQSASGWRVYPGSPLLMYALMTQGARVAVHDRLKLFELHPTDIHALQAHVAQLDAGRRVTVARQDGFEGLKALLPPPPAAGGLRRALVLIDPSYEIKSDYAKVPHAVQDALRRFATGVYLVWHPLIARPEAHELPRRLRTLSRQAGRGWLYVTLNVGATPGTSGLSASGMFVINPPHTLAAALTQALPQVLQALQDKGMRGSDWHIETGESARA